MTSGVALSLRTLATFVLAFASLCLWTPWRVSIGCGDTGSTAWGTYGILGYYDWSRLRDPRDVIVAEEARVDGMALTGTVLVQAVLLASAARLWRRGRAPSATAPGSAAPPG